MYICQYLLVSTYFALILSRGLNLASLDGTKKVKECRLLSDMKVNMSRGNICICVWKGIFLKKLGLLEKDHQV